MMHPQDGSPPGESVIPSFVAARATAYDAVHVRIELQVSGYRSLRNVNLPLQQLNVITGPNGSGKSNLYRVLWLIAQICEGQFARTLAREGGCSRPPNLPTNLGGLMPRRSPLALAV